jgi:hypothetical protein
VTSVWIDHGKLNEAGEMNKHDMTMKRNTILLILFLSWILLLTMTSKNKISSDGFLEVGFPFIFYRGFGGKGNYAELDLGLRYGKLIIDVLIFLTIAIGVSKLLSLRRR